MFDKLWFDFSNQHEQIWLSEDEDSPANARKMISSPKTILTAVRNSHGVQVVRILSRECKWTSRYPIDNILPEICALHFAGYRRRLVGLADNARPYASPRGKQYTEDHSVRTAPHLSYSPDLAPSDFFLLAYLKRALRGSEFQSMEELLEAGVRILSAIPTGPLIGIFHEWTKRFEVCIHKDGEYVE
jgi:hypothetical protein